MVDPVKLCPISFDSVNNGYFVLGERVGNVFSDGFYCGWPKAWSTFPMIEEVYGSVDVRL